MNRPAHWTSNLSPDDPLAQIRAMLDQDFIWNTGMRGTLVAEGEDVARGGSWHDRGILIFRAPDGGVFTWPAKHFLPLLQPWEKQHITGSGHEPAIYGPYREAGRTGVSIGGHSMP